MLSLTLLVDLPVFVFGSNQRASLEEILRSTVQARLRLHLTVAPSEYSTVVLSKSTHERRSAVIGCDIRLESGSRRARGSL